MEPQDRKLLEQVLQMTEQNNEILRSMKRGIVIQRITRIIYWIIIIGITYWSYIALQPYLSDLNKVMQYKNMLPK